MNPPVGSVYNERHQIIGQQSTDGQWPEYCAAVKPFGKETAAVSAMI